MVNDTKSRQFMDEKLGPIFRIYYPQIYPFISQKSRHLKDDLDDLMATGECIGGMSGLVHGVLALAHKVRNKEHPQAFDLCVAALEGKIAECFAEIGFSWQELRQFKKDYFAVIFKGEWSELKQTVMEMPDSVMENLFPGQDIRLDEKEVIGNFFEHLRACLWQHQGIIGGIIKQSGFDKSIPAPMNFLADYFLEKKPRPLSDVFVGFYKLCHFVNNEPDLPETIKGNQRVIKELAKISKDLMHAAADFIDAHADLTASVDFARLGTARSPRDFPPPYRIVNVMLWAIGQIDAELLKNVFPPETRAAAR